MQQAYSLRCDTVRVRVEGDCMHEHQRERSNGIVARLSRAGLSLQEDAVRKAILKAFAAEGHAPSVQALAHALGLPLAAVLAACRTRAAADLLVWQAATTQIVSVYPFSESQTAHQVLLGGHTTRYARCAIDALGIPSYWGRGRACTPRVFSATRQ
jgi:hypothetical protein